MKNKKLSETRKRLLLEQGRILLILLCISALIVIIISFMNSWHNLDLIFNINTITNQINQAGFQNLENQTLYIPFDRITDKGSDFVSRPLEDFYISSNNNIRKYFILGLLDCLLLGLLLAGGKHEN